MPCRRGWYASIDDIVVIDEAGGHSTVAWSPYIPQVLRWIGSTVPGFRP